MKFYLVAIITALFSFVAPATQCIHPGELWVDNEGKHIQAHGGGITKLNDTFYWFGEDRAPENPPVLRCVSCYSSTNFTDWTHRGQVLKLANPENFETNWVLERPKVFYNKATKKFVMYMHIDGVMPGEEFGYKLARVGVAVSDAVDGGYKYLKSFRPLGNESRDIGQFIDDDGSAYLISSDSYHGFRIYQLSEDYLNIEKEIYAFTNLLEGGALVHYDGLYYFVGSHCTGWDANANVYATAKSLAGPWSEFKNVAPSKAKTYGSQSTMLLKITGTKTNTVVFMGDIWKPEAIGDSRYLWMPLEIGGGNLKLPAPREWTLDTITGTVTFRNSFRGKTR